MAKSWAEQKRELEEWVKTLKVGDVVAARNHSYAGAKYNVYTIEKITPTGKIRLSNGTLLNEQGYNSGSGSWGRYTQIEPLTDEILADINRYKLARKLVLTMEEFDPEDYTNEELETILKLITKEKE